MKIHHRAFLGSILVLLASGLLTGCVAVAVGAGAAGAVGWYRGELRANLTQNVPQVNKAVATAIDELKFFKISARTDELTGNFTARNAKDDRITVIVEQGGEGVTLVRIRVGVFGNETVSRAILDTIKANL